MNIYIPKHIKQIGVVSKLCKLIENYNDAYNYEDPFYDYYYYLNSDPVKRFLYILNISKDEAIINYLTALFYSLKGCTSRIFECMENYLNIETTSLNYSTSSISFTIEEITLDGIDEGLFRSSLFGFLNSLLYFRDYNIKIKVLKLNLNGTLDNNVATNVIIYNTIDLEEEE